MDLSSLYLLFVSISDGLHPSRMASNLIAMGWGELPRRKLRLDGLVRFLDIDRNLLSLSGFFRGPEEANTHPIGKDRSIARHEMASGKHNEVQNDDFFVPWLALWTWCLPFDSGHKVMKNRHGLSVQTASSLRVDDLPFIPSPIRRHVSPV